jgi:hypothetical protein
MTAARAYHCTASSQQHHSGRIEKSRKALVERDETITLGSIGLVPNNPIGKIAAGREHRDTRFSGGPLDLNGADGDEAAQDINDLRTRVSVGPLQHTHTSLHNTTVGTMTASAPSRISAA